MWSTSRISASSSIGVPAWACWCSRERTASAISRRPPYPTAMLRSEEHTSELQSQSNLVCRLLLDTPTPAIYTLSLHDALPISAGADQEIGIRLTTGIQVLGDVVDVEDLRQLLDRGTRLGVLVQQGTHRVGDLAPAAVPDGDVEIGRAHV